MKNYCKINQQKKHLQLKKIKAPLKKRKLWKEVMENFIKKLILQHYKYMVVKMKAILKVLKQILTQNKNYNYQTHNPYLMYNKFNNHNLFNPCNKFNKYNLFNQCNKFNKYNHHKLKILWLNRMVIIQFDIY